MSRQSQSQRDGDSSRYGTGSSNQNGFQKGGSGQECFFCKEMGHRKPDCPKFKTWLESKKGGGGGGGGAGQRGRPMRGAREEKPTQMEEEGSFYDKEGTKPGDEDWGGPEDEEPQQERKEEKNTLNEVFKPAEDKNNFSATEEKSRVIRDPRLKGLLQPKIPKKPKPQEDPWQASTEKTAEGIDTADDDGWGVREKDSPEKKASPEKQEKEAKPTDNNDRWGFRKKDTSEKKVKSVDKDDDAWGVREKDSTENKPKATDQDKDKDDAWGVREKDTPEKVVKAANKDADDAWGVRKKDSSEKKSQATNKDDAWGVRKKDSSEKKPKESNKDDGWGVREKDSSDKKAKESNKDDGWGVREKDSSDKKAKESNKDDGWGVREKDCSENKTKQSNKDDGWGVREKDSPERKTKESNKDDGWGVRKKDSPEKKTRSTNNDDGWGVRKKDSPEKKTKATNNDNGWGVRQKSADRDESTKEDTFASELERQISKKLGFVQKSKSPSRKGPSNLRRSRSPPRNSFRESRTPSNQRRTPPRKNRSPEQQLKSSLSREREQKEREYWEGNRRKDRYLLTRGRFTKEREERDWGLTSNKPYKEPTTRINTSRSSEKMLMEDNPFFRGQAANDRLYNDPPNDRLGNRPTMLREDNYQNTWQNREEKLNSYESNSFQSYNHPDEYQPPIPPKPLRQQQGAKILSQQDNDIDSQWKKRQSNTDWGLSQESFSQVQRPQPGISTQFKDDLLKKQKQSTQQWGNNDYSENIPNQENYNFNSYNPASQNGDRLRADPNKTNNAYQLQNDFGRFNNPNEISRNNGNNPFAPRNLLIGNGDQGRKNVSFQKRDNWAEQEKIDETKNQPYVQAIRMNTVTPESQRPLRQQPRQQSAMIVIDDEEADLRRQDSYRQNSLRQFQTAQPSRQKLTPRDFLNKNYNDGNISPVYEPDLGSNKKKKRNNNMLVNPDDEQEWTMASPTYVPDRDDRPSPNYDRDDKRRGYSREHYSLENIYDFDKEEDEYGELEYQSRKFKSCVEFRSDSQLQNVDLLYLKEKDFFEQNLLQCLYPHKDNNSNCFLAYEGHIKMKKQVLNISEVIDAKVMAYSNHSWSQLQILPSLKQTIQPRSTKEFKPLDFETVAKTLKQMIKREHYDRIFYLLWLEGATKEDNQKLDSFSKYLYDNRLVSGVNMENYCFTMAHIGQIFPGVQQFKRPSSQIPVKLVLIVNLEVYFQIGYRPVPF